MNDVIYFAFQDEIEKIAATMASKREGTSSDPGFEKWRSKQRSSMETKVTPGPGRSLDITPKPGTKQMLPSPGRRGFGGKPFKYYGVKHAARPKPY